MAATDIRYGGFDPVLYTPDFSFLKYVIDKKTSQYEAGLKSVSSAYNNLKKQLTDPVNVEKRDQYLKDAQGQLQKIASSDLSLQQNVNFANSIFDPIATDKAIVFDAYHTDRIKNELEKEDMWMSSEDPEVRKKYNPEIKEWVSRDLDILKNGKGDLNNYKKMRGRSAVAYVDPQDILDKAVKDKGFKVKADELGQPYIVSVEGGPGFTKNYKQFANDILANDQTYIRQIGILGENRKEKTLEKYRTDPTLAPTWSTKTDDEILAAAGADNYNTHKVQQKDYLDTLNKNLIEEDAEIKAALNGPNSAKYIQGATDVGNGNNATPEAQLYLSLKEKADNLNNLKGKYKELEDDYTSTYTGDKTRDEYIKKFVSDPAGYFADLQFKNDVTRFSNIKSASFTRTIKEDRAYVDVTVAKTNAMATLNKMKDTEHDNILADAKFQELLRMDDAKLAMLGKKKVKNADGTTAIVDLDTNADIKFVDLSATQLNTVQAYDQLRDRVSTASAKVLGSLTDNFGAFYLLQSMGLDPQKVSTIRGMYTRYFNTDNKNEFKATAQETKALSDASTAMKAFIKTNPNLTLSDQEKNNLLGQTLTIDKLPDLLDKAIVSYKTTNENEKYAKRAMVEYKANSQLLIEANTNLQKAKKVVIDNIKTERKFWPYLAKRKDGSLDIIDDEDIFKRLKKSVFLENPGKWSSNIRVTLNDTDLRNISKSYIDGTLDVKHHMSNPDNAFDRGDYYYFTYNGKDYEVQGGTELKKGTLTDAFLSIPSNVVNSPLRTRVVPGAETNFPGTTKDFQEKLQKINERVPIPTFQEGVGNVSASPIFKISGGLRQDVLDDLSDVTLTNSNIYEYDEGTAKASQSKPELQGDIRKALKNKENIVDNGVSIFTSSPLNGGGQAVAITFKTITGSENNPAPGWSGKTFYFPISVTNSSPKIFHAFNEINEASEFSPYQKSGSPYSLNTFEAEGVKAIFQPRQPGASDGTIQLWYKPYNAVTKTYSDTWQIYEQPYQQSLVYDLAKKTFPEYKDDVYNGFIYPYVNGTITFGQQQQANTIASGGTVITKEGLYNSLIH